MARRKSKKTAYATIHFRQALNDAGVKQLCVYAECQRSGNVVGPTWGHADQSVRRALAELTNRCDCPARFHKTREYAGHRVMTPGSRPRQ
jgi:hypothetical protein